MLTITHINDEWVFQESDYSLLEDDIFTKALDFYQDGNYGMSEILLKSLIEKYPSNIDAFHHLSLLFDDTSRELEAYLSCREAVRIGFEILSSNFNWEKSKLEWGHLENRPFLRAYHNLGLWELRRNRIDYALQIFINLLSISPNDNLGVRYILPKLWLEKGDVLSVIRHGKKFEDDLSPEMLYTYALALILSGENSKAKNILDKAIQHFPFVAQELKKKTHKKPKSLMPGSITWGGKDQAYYYWMDYGKFWSNNKKAMELLSQV